MLIIVTSDHGEAFGEHRQLQHSTSLYTEILDVPLLVKPPSKFHQAAQALRSGIAQSVDLFPTVLEHASVPIPEGIDGVAWGRGRNYALAWLFPHSSLVQAYPDRFNFELESVQTVNWKLVRSSTGEIKLYNLSAPPGERTSVADQYPEKVREFISILDPYTDYREDHLPSNKGGVSEDVLERLRSLGYLP
jgi:arylsulfatase A-like enzyme